MRQRPQYLLSAFAKAGHPVYFVDYSENGIRSEQGVTICGSLREVPKTGVILYVHFAPLRHLIDQFEDVVVVYDILDDLSIYESDEGGLPEARRVRSHHPMLMQHADVVIVSNEVLVERHRDQRSDLLLVRNSVDPELFGAPTPRPPDLPEVDPDRPVIGYHGMISTWFDFDLLETVARARPEWRFVLVGPVDPKVASRLDGVLELPNLILLGERPSNDMPGYVQGFDVCVIWFTVDEMTEAVTPLKMYESFAAGVPCVATPLPACLAEPLVATAGDTSDMIAAIEGALRSDVAELRAEARRHSWDEALEPVLQRLDELALRNARPR